MILRAVLRICYPILTSSSVVATDDLRSYDAVVVCVLSHGLDDEQLLSSDGCFNLDMIREALNYNPFLIGKPKIMIIQVMNQHK